MHYAHYNCINGGGNHKLETNNQWQNNNWMNFHLHMCMNQLHAAQYIIKHIQLQNFKL